MHACVRWSTRSKRASGHLVSGVSLSVSFPTSRQANEAFHVSSLQGWSSVFPSLRCQQGDLGVTLDSAQLAEVLPPAQLLARMFAAFPATGAAALDAVCSLAAVAFAFVVMPAGDVLMGRDLQGGASMVRPSQGWCLYAGDPARHVYPGSQRCWLRRAG